MKSSGLLIAALVLLALSGVMFWSNRHRPNSVDEGNAKVQEVESPKILAFDHANVVQLSIRRKNQAPVEPSQSGTDAWQITRPTPLGADQEAVSNLLTSFSSISSDRVIDDKPSD